MDGGQGNYEVAGYWPSGGIMKDFYSAISGFDNQLIKPVGETGSGQGPALGTTRRLPTFCTSWRIPTRTAMRPMTCMFSSCRRL